MFVGRWIRCLNVEEPSRLLIRRLVCLIRRLEAASTQDGRKQTVEGAMSAGLVYVYKTNHYECDSTS